MEDVKSGKQRGPGVELRHAWVHVDRGARGDGAVETSFQVRGGNRRRVRWKRSGVGVEATQETHAVCQALVANLKQEK